MTKFRLVVFGDRWDEFQHAHRDWIDNPAVSYIPTYRPSGLLGQINRLHLNPSVNRLLPLPGKSRWNAYFLRHTTDAHVCFLVTEHWLRLESGLRLLPYLRHHYPQSRIVCFTQDMVDTICDYYTRRPIDLAHMRRYADLLISYDLRDAQMHDMLYHPTVFSPVDPSLADEKPVFDLYFLGRDKGRLPHLVNICREAQRRGLKCNFLLLDVPVEERIPCDGITYLDRQLSYADNLRLCAQSRCIVEMLQRHAASPTFRTWEAIMLNRKLLTDNTALSTSDIYDTRYVSVFTDEDSIDWQFMQSDASFPGGLNPFQQQIRPLALVRFIEQHLHIQIQYS